MLGGRPPLAEGWGMGMGEWAGEGIRWAAVLGWGELWPMAGDSKPNLGWGPAATPLLT